MKTIINIFTIAIIITSLFSCEDENSPIFIAQEDTDGIQFLNSFASEYLLSEDTKTNIADRLIWNEPNFEVQTNINYQIEGATDIEFNTFKLLGSTSETNFPVLVSNLLAFTSDLELDDNPNTTDTNGLPNNSGILFLRAKAFLGCFALHWFALHCFALLCTALLCFALICIYFHCFGLLCFAMLCFAMLCFALLCSALVFFSHF